MHRLILAAVLLPGCYASRVPSLECQQEQPYYLFHHDSPPQGRMWACEVFERTVELCPDVVPTVTTGACDYSHAMDYWNRGCPESEDPCVRPDPRYYWREDGS